MNLRQASEARRWIASRRLKGTVTLTCNTPATSLGAAPASQRLGDKTRPLFRLCPRAWSEPGTLAPITGLLGSFVPAGNAAQSRMLQNLGNMKPTLIAAYGEQDRIIVATSGDLLGMSLTNLVSGNLLGIPGSAIPFNQFQGGGSMVRVRWQEPVTG